MFNREYHPIWERNGGPAVAAKVDGGVPWTRRCLFYGEHDSPEYSSRTRRVCEGVLEAFRAGLPVTAPICFADERDNLTSIARVIYDRDAPGATKTCAAAG